MTSKEVISLHICGGQIQYIGKRAKVLYGECLSCKEKIVFSNEASAEKALSPEKEAA